MRLYTIGFTQKPAERFFGLLAEAGVGRLVDTRLRPGGQLAGFANGRDLPWLLDRLVGCGYVHLPILAPTAEILDGYRADGHWARYVERFEALLDERGIPDALDQAAFAATANCLLCSEATPERCHRRLVAERLAREWGVAVVHLV
ncbi:MAG: hypothetical protein AVDCRST_MAG59-3180 [uncultured Thermomicrobiales bacterium]|uniref:DUF488 domain-containing protein n=1 Tax=uncultured Thermomicrobiales bacterium TaxID=1645740 RepID=A0A6J4V8W2_9BACT|nr:MAG: hypothetical protein AVDCRST_MAG59-3180 [uncultured Thermomicrobiales bacterium]